MGDQGQTSELFEKLGEIGEFLLKISNANRNLENIELKPAIPLRDDSNTSDISTERMRAFARIASHEYQARLKRKTFINRDVFGEPAWDILLDLFVARVEGVRLSVKAVCIGAQVPLTTALRWITVLESEGLLERFPDQTDARRVWIELSDSGFFRMFSYFKDLTSAPVRPMPNLASIPTVGGNHASDD